MTQEKTLPPLALQLEMSAVNLLLEALAAMPINRALPLFTALKETTEKHITAKSSEASPE
jgi:hypothetical protein